MTLANALKEAFHAMGVNILHDPNRLLSTLMDLCDERDPLWRVMERNCDNEFLEPFSAGVETGTSSAIHAASQRGQEVLSVGRMIDPRISRLICEAMEQALLPYVIQDQSHHIIPDYTNTAKPVEKTSEASSSTQQQENTSNGADSPKKSKRRIIPTALFAAIVNCIIVYFATMGSCSSIKATFVDNSVGPMIRESAIATDGVVIMPEALRERAGYDFVGWRLGENTYQPGNEYAIKENVSFEAVWEKRTCIITFDGNGADSGKMKVKHCEYGEELILPKCKFTRSGCIFDCWSLGNRELQPGETVTVKDDISITAQWVHDSAACLEVERFFTSDTSDNDYFGALFVRNISKDNLAVTATFTHKDDSGNVVGTDTTTSHGLIAPGEVGLLFTYSEAVSDTKASSVTSIDYELEIDEMAFKGASPLSESIQMHEVACNDGVVEVELSNTEDNEVYIADAIMLAINESNTSFAFKMVDVGMLDAMETKVITFENTEFDLTEFNRQFFLRESAL